jgi:hypothetical protein
VLVATRFATQTCVMPLISIQKKYLYEVAFSFLEVDESLAFQIHDLISDRLSTFIYSNQQRKLIGKDGVDVLTKVYAEEARVVVILYREGWGTTYWTRAEELAIKNRSLEESADFTIFASLDNQKPAWLSKSQIWYNMKRFGVKTIADNIETKVNERGGIIRLETTVDQAARLTRAIELKEKIKKYIESPEAAADFNVEKGLLLSVGYKIAKGLKENNLSLQLQVDNIPEEEFSIKGNNVGLTFELDKSRDGMRKRRVKVFIANADFYWNRNTPFQSGHIHHSEDYTFYLNNQEEKCWANSNRTELFSTDQLLEHWQKKFLALAAEERIADIQRRSLY